MGCLLKQGGGLDMAAPRHVERYEGVDCCFCCDCCLATLRESPAKYAAIRSAAQANSAT